MHVSNKMFCRDVEDSGGVLGWTHCGLLHYFLPNALSKRPHHDFNHVVCLRNISFSYICVLNLMLDTQRQCFLNLQVP